MDIVSGSRERSAEPMTKEEIRRLQKANMQRINAESWLLAPIVSVAMVISFIIVFAGKLP
jgi:predicted Co/Zn/Cd cation transporter (cation efflux family)